MTPCPAVWHFLQALPRDDRLQAGLGASGMLARRLQGTRTATPGASDRDSEANVLDRDEIVKTNDRRLKIRVLQRFERESASVRELEREFALAALEMIRCQPVMAEAAGVEAEPPEQVPARRHAWPASSLEQARDC